MRRIAPALLLGIAALALAAEPIAVSITALNDKPADFHLKDIVTTGKVAKFSNKTSKAGNEYFKFDLTEPGKGREIKVVHVYGMGKMEPPLKDGSSVTVTGEFKKEKIVSGRTYKMEIEVKPKNVKLATEDE